MGFTGNDTRYDPNQFRIIGLAELSLSTNLRANQRRTHWGTIYKPDDSGSTKAASRNKLYNYFFLGLIR